MQHKKFCFLDDEKDYCILGISFISRFYAIFDVGENRVGLALSRFANELLHVLISLYDLAFNKKKENFSTRFATEAIKMRPILQPATNCEVEGDSGDAVGNPSHCLAFYPSKSTPPNFLGGDSELDCCWTANNVSLLSRSLIGRVFVHQNSTMYALQLFLFY